MWKYWTNERQQKWLWWRYKYWEIDREPKSGTNWLVSWRKCHNKTILMKGQKYETCPQMAFESKRTTTKIQNFVGSNLESPKLMHKLMGKVQLPGCKVYKKSETRCNKKLRLYNPDSLVN